MSGSMAASPAMSPTLAINQAVGERTARGLPTLHLGFGEAGLPVHPVLADALARSAPANAYGPVAGDLSLRQSVAGYYARRGLETDPELVIAAPGSKALLFALQLVLGGDLVLPRPSWVSYEPQARLTGKAVLRVDAAEQAGGVPDPDQLEVELARARRDGINPRILLLNHPDNPTGTVAHAGLLQRVLDVARANGLIVISDEIYRDLVYEPESFVSAALLDRENVLVTSGLSKGLALGGWRVGVLRAPDTRFGRQLVRDVIGAASEIWSCLPGPIAGAARVGFDEPPELQAFVASGRLLHAEVTTAFYQAACEAGAACRAPSAAYYLYPDLEPLRTELHRAGISSGAELAARLLDRSGVAVLPGIAFGDRPERLTFRLATSLLYGATAEERWETLRMAGVGDVLGTPRIAAALTTFTDALGRLV